VKNSFKTLTLPELKAKLAELKKKYMELRFKLVIGHVDNPLQKRTIRRQIARLNTLIRAHEIGETTAEPGGDGSRSVQKAAEAK
jgi:large subunit ribosomal protein L29